VSRLRPAGFGGPGLVRSSGRESETQEVERQVTEYHLVASIHSTLQSRPKPFISILDHAINLPSASLGYESPNRSRIA
jgi:hypothetical protein